MPDVDNIRDRRSRLSGAKQSLLLKRLGGEDHSVTARRAIPRRAPGGGPVPLSFAQERLWFLDRMDPGKPTYNIPYAFRLHGPLRIDFLRTALGEIVRRHEALRTTFSMIDGTPVQRIGAPAPVDLPLLDLGGMPGEEGEARARILAHEEAHLPFDLERGPLFRARIARLAPDDHLLLITVHHIVFDGWSDGLFFRELRILFEAAADGRAPSLEEPPLQYADYALWQRNLLQGEELSRQMSYWKNVLRGDLPVLELPADFPRPAVQAHGGRTTTLLLPPALHEALVEMSSRLNVTLFMTLLAAFDVLLHRYCAQDDVIVGTPIAGRSQPETEGVIGFFVNTLVLRTDCSGDPGFRELLVRVRDGALGAFEHQDVPFEKVVEEIHPHRTSWHAPVIQALFVLQRLESRWDAAGGIRWTDVRPRLDAAKFDITLSVQESADGLLACLEHRTDLFSGSTARRMLKHFRSLLSSIVARPDEKISSLAIMDPSEEEALRRLGRGPAAVYTSPGTYQSAFESAVRKWPDSPALRFDGRQLTYGELNARANRLARHLRALGARPGVTIGIMMNRSLELPAGLLGILKSGAAYLPLDPGLPGERLALMLREASVPVAVIHSAYRERFRGSGVGVVPLDDAEFCRTSLDGESPDDPEPLGRPDDLAYVIFTSGSTGAPKGVEVEHRSLLNHNFALARALGLTRSDRVLQFFETSFDASIEDIMPTWLSGSTLVLRPVDTSSNVARFLAHVASEQITVLTVPTAFWHELVEDIAEGGLPPSVRLVAFGGEKALAGKLDAWRRHAGVGVRLINLYGPTEGTVAATMCELTARRDGMLPIGRPIANTYVYLLDGHGRHVPRGAAGEICIGGAGLARGYLNNPGLTAEKFVPDPFAPRPGMRLYRTGDMGRFLADGQIEFLGRRDTQVKVRGYRIELGEVESVLALHDAVRQAAVTTYEDGTGNTMLAAYVVMKENAPPVADGELPAWLRSRLPDYMVPASYTVMDALPLTSNGKIDRKALRPPAPRERRAVTGYVAPRDSLESQIAFLWEQVLGKDHVGVYDDFFALGGHSLMAARLFAQIGRVTGKNLPLATLFQAPTIDQLASVLRREGWRPLWSSLVPMKTGGSRPPFYCVHAAGGNVIGYSELAARLGPDQPVYGLQAVGLDGKEPPLDRVEEMASRYVKEIRACQPSGPYYLGGACTGGIVAYEIAQQLLALGEEVGLLAMFDTFAHSHMKTLTRAEILRYRWESSLERLRYHAGNLILHPGRLEYIRRKSRTLRRRFGTRVWEILYTWYARHSGRIPPAMLRVEQFNILAIRKYIPRPYPGRITLFPASTRSVGEFHDREQGWGKLALGGVEIHDVTGDHLTMLQMPNVTSVAEILNECLERAYKFHAHPD